MVVEVTGVDQGLKGCRLGSSTGERGQLPQIDRRERWREDTQSRAVARTPQATGWPAHDRVEQLAGRSTVADRSQGLDTTPSVHVDTLAGDEKPRPWHALAAREGLLP